MTRPSHSIGFPLLCALAYAGGVIGYLPLLGLLLPIKVAAIAGPDRFAVLALVLVVGAVAAGGSNILFGWLSDRSCRRGGGRRRWMVAGLAGTLASFALIALARTPVAIVAAIAAFQVALNAMLAPMMALIAEEVPDAQTGFTTGLFAAGPPIASLLAVGLAVPALTGEAARLAVIGAALLACLAPLLATRSRGRGGAAAAPAAAPRSRRDLVLAWVARLLVQVAGTVLFADLVYLMDEPAGSGGGATLARMGSLLLLANLAPLPVSVLCGRWSDRVARRKPFLLATAVLAVLGLVTMAAAPGWSGRAVGFVVFAATWGAFLPLQVGYIMELLPDPRWRGRDLGLVNLSNTLPTLIGQGLAWRMATPHHADSLLLALAALTLAGGLTMLGVRGRR